MGADSLLCCIPHRHANVTHARYTGRMDTPQPPRVVFLGSGSAGNATAIAAQDSIILIDCGFSAKELSARLRSVQLNPSHVCAILVTHEHSDHVRGIDVFVRRHAPLCTVHATRGTLRHVTASSPGIGTRELHGGREVSLGPFRVLPFETSHDADHPLGFRVDVGNTAVGIVTDTGVLTEQCAEALTGVTVLGIESNHDLQMLRTGPYPSYLKRRIDSETGHLSNAAAADAVERLASHDLRCVVGLHLSAENNTVPHVQAALSGRVSDIGLEAVRVSVASQSSPCEPWIIPQA